MQIQNRSDTGLSLIHISRIGRAVLVNSGAIVDHNSVVCAGAHVGLGSVVKSDCTIESGRKVEAGEVIFSTRRKIEGVDSRSLEDAVYAFGFAQQCSYVKPFGEGRINETYAVYMPGADGKDTPLYVLQRININAVSYTHLDVYKRQVYWPVGPLVHPLPDSSEQYIYDHIVSVPCDQRFTPSDMQYVAQVLMDYSGN